MVLAAQVLLVAVAEVPQWLVTQSPLQEPERETGQSDSAARCTRKPRRETRLQQPQVQESASSAAEPLHALAWEQEVQSPQKLPQETTTAR